MKTLTLLLIPLLFLSSCTIDWNDEKDKKITELNQKIETQKDEIKKVKDETSFERNKDCSKYLDKLVNENQPDQNFGILMEPEIFYSPINKSCIFTYEIDYKKGGAYIEAIDALSNKRIYTIFPFEKQDVTKDREKFNIEISKLK